MTTIHAHFTRLYIFIWWSTPPKQSAQMEATTIIQTHKTRAHTREKSRGRDKMRWHTHTQTKNTRRVCLERCKQTQPHIILVYIYILQYSIERRRSDNEAAKRELLGKPSLGWLKAKSQPRFELPLDRARVCSPLKTGGFAPYTRQWCVPWPRYGTAWRHWYSCCCVMCTERICEWCACCGWISIELYSGSTKRWASSVLNNQLVEVWLKASRSIHQILMNMIAITPIESLARMCSIMTGCSLREILKLCFTI